MSNGNTPIQKVVSPKYVEDTWTGFTIVELVLLIGLLGILSLAALVFSPSISTSRLQTAARQVQSDIEYAKQNATMTGQTSGVSFVSGGSYTVYQGTTATPLSSPLTRQNMVILLSSSYPSISIASNYVVEFDAMGAPTTGGGGSVSLTNGTTTRTVSVTANTGRVTVP